MIKNLRERYGYSLILLKQLVKTDFKLRYQSSVLGYMWSLLKPLALFVILLVVFSNFLKVGDDIPHFPIYLLLGIVLWNYFAEVTGGSVNAIVSKSDILRKINFPRYVIVLAGSVSALINLALSFVIVIVFMLVDNVDIRPAIFLLPLLIVELFIFALAVAFFLSAAFVRFRDLNHIWDVVMQAAFYITPILYPISMVIKQAGEMPAKILMLNPAAQIIQDAREIMVTPETQTISEIYGSSTVRLIPLGIVMLSVVIAAWYFRSRSKYFAEEV